MADTTKFRRLFNLYERFHNHGQLTVSQMMREYGVERRTVNRDLLDLKEIGLEFEAREAGGHKVWMLRQRSRKVTVAFNLTDLAALFMGRRLFDFLEGTILEESLDKVYGAIEIQLERENDFAKAKDLARKVHLVSEGPKHLAPEHVECLDDVLTGLLHEEKIRFDYVDAHGEARTEVVLCPYTLVAFRRGLYVLGRKDETDELRTYALERIQRTRWMKGARFSVPKDFDPKAHFERALYLQTGAPTRVELIFSATTEPFIGIRRFHGTQETKKLPDGRILLTMEVPAGERDFEIENFVLSFHENVEVVSPPSLREAVKRRLRNALGLYGQ